MVFSVVLFYLHWTSLYVCFFPPVVLTPFFSFSVLLHEYLQALPSQHSCGCPVYNRTECSLLIQQNDFLNLCLCKIFMHAAILMEQAQAVLHEVIPCTSPNIEESGI